MSKNASAQQTVAAAALLLVATAASAGPLPGFNLAAQTPHFSFYSRGAKVEADKAEKYLAKLEQMLGADFKGQATYYRHERMEDIAAVTGAYAVGVTLKGRNEIHSTKGFHAHEIVHLVAGEMGNPGAFFNEGLAVALGNDGRWNGADVDKA